MNPAHRMLQASLRLGLTISLAGTAAAGSAVILSASSCRSAVVTSEDATLQEKISESLHRDHLDMISVSVRGARVTLSGTVSSPSDRVIARRDAEQVDGVRAVINNVRFTP